MKEAFKTETERTKAIEKRAKVREKKTCQAVCISLTFVCVLSRVQLFETPCTVAHQAPLSMEFSRKEYWSRLPFPTTGIFPTWGSNL